MHDQKAARTEGIADQFRLHLSMDAGTLTRIPADVRAVALALPRRRLTLSAIAVRKGRTRNRGLHPAGRSRL